MKKALRPAFTATIPVLCGYLFIGFAFGVMLRDIGFGSIWSFFCSLTIYAGSGQYLLVSLAQLPTYLLRSVLSGDFSCDGPPQVVHDLLADR